MENNKKENPSLKDIYEQIEMFMEVAATKEGLQNLRADIKEDMNVLKTELKKEIGTARDMAFVHADIKSTNAATESGIKINAHEGRDKNFKDKLVSVMKNNELASAQELEGLAQAI
ncbi:MAG: hypothetical protein AAB348_02975, partial [Patescibacteria group bacterium]